MLKYLKDVVENTPEGCTCTVDEQVNLADTTVTGYVLVAECSICQTLRTSSATSAEVLRKSTRILEIKNKIVCLETEKDKANTLGYSDLVTAKTNEIAVLQSELATLEE